MGNSQDVDRAVLEVILIQLTFFAKDMHWGSINLQIYKWTTKLSWLMISQKNHHCISSWKIKKPAISTLRFGNKMGHSLQAKDYR